MAIIISLMIGALIPGGAAPYREMVRSIISSQMGDVRYGPWSIGIYTGSTPFEINDPAEISNST